MWFIPEYIDGDLVGFGEADFLDLVLCPFLLRIDSWGESKENMTLNTHVFNPLLPGTL